MSPHEPAPRAPRTGSAWSLRAGLALGELDEQGLWVGQLALGGAMTRAVVRAVAHGHREADDREHDLLTVVLNEHLADLGLPALVRTSAELDPGYGPPSRPRWT